MPTLFVTSRDGVERAVDAQPHGSVMEAIRDSGDSELLALCGGCCSCATCHVYVDPDFYERLLVTSQEEEGLLEGSIHRRTTSRLSCQIQMTDELAGMRVTIAPED